MSVEILNDAAAHALELAKAKGANEADVVAARGTEFEVKVADGKIVTLTQAVSKGLGVRVFLGKTLGFCTSNDFGKDSLEHAVARAVQMAKHTAEDPHNGLPAIEPGTLRAGVELDLFDPAIPALETEEKIRWAHALEEAARAADPRVTKFRDSGVASGESTTVLATSSGAVRVKESTGISLWCNPLATDGDELQTELWYDSKTHLEDLEAVEEIGKKAGLRAARMLGAKQVPTQRATVIFEPHMAAGMFAGMLTAIDGDRVYKGASFLADKLNETIASPAITLVDDPLLSRGTGSAPFDGEGLRTYRKALLEDGRLTTFLYDSYTARKAGAKPTASARRGFGSPPHAGPFNLFVERGEKSTEEILRTTKRGLLITRGLGHGLNAVSGEYSRGANGLWIEDGEIVHPVQEVTIAGDFLDMLQGIDQVGNDLMMRGSIGAPTIRVGEMTLSGA